MESLLPRMDAGQRTRTKAGKRKGFGFHKARKRPRRSAPQGEQTEYLCITGLDFGTTTTVAENQVEKIKITHSPNGPTEELQSSSEVFPQLFEQPATGVKDGFETPTTIWCSVDVNQAKRTPELGWSLAGEALGQPRMRIPHLKRGFTDLFIGDLTPAARSFRAACEKVRAELQSRGACDIDIPDTDVIGRRAVLAYFKAIFSRCRQDFQDPRRPPANYREQFGQYLDNSLNHIVRLAAPAHFLPVVREELLKIAMEAGAKAVEWDDEGTAGIAGDLFQDHWPEVSD